MEVSTRSQYYNSMTGNTRVIHEFNWTDFPTLTTSVGFATVIPTAPDVIPARILIPRSGTI